MSTIEQNTLLLLEMTLGIIAAGGLAGWAVANVNKPKHLFRAWTPAGGEIPYKLKKLGAEFVWTDPDDKEKKVTFPLLSEFARRGPKGSLRWTGDTKTGSLLRFDEVTNKWEYIDPRYFMASFDAKRSQELASSTQAGKFDKFVPYFLPALIVIAVVLMGVAWMVYQVYSKRQGA